MWRAKALHCFSEEFQCCFAVTALGNIAFKHLALVIHSPPEIVSFTVDFYEHFVQMPFPIRMSTRLLNPFSSDLRGEQRPKAIPPKSHSLMTDFDPALMQQILHIPERQGEPDVQHHRKADDVGTGLEISKWAVFGHVEKLDRHPALHNQISSDRTTGGVLSCVDGSGYA